MNKGLVSKLLFISGKAVLLLDVFSFFALVYLFSNGLETTIFSYGIYAISAYSLAVSLIKLVALYRKGKNSRWIKRLIYHPLVQRYQSDMSFKRNVSLFNGIAVNLIFAFFKMIMSYLYSSVWLFSIGMYYLMLSLIRFTLIVKLNKSYKKEENKRNRYENNCYISTGTLMFLLNVVMGGMIIQMIWHNQSYKYPGFMIYLSALFAFYSLISACIRLIKDRKNKAPIMSCIKTVALVGALMSIYILQVGMIDQFGSDEHFRMLMNTLSGGFIMIIVFFMAVMMVITGLKRRKEC